MPRWDAIVWDGDDHLSIDDIHFWLTTTDYQTPSTAEQFVLLKNRALLESYREAFGFVPHIAKILELGYYHGASTVLYDRLLLPERLIAVDHMPEAPFLEAYRISRQRAAAVVPYYDIEQQDLAALTTILERECPDRDLDVVIDDASHEYAATRAAFERIWPFVRPGGMYIVEDWGWAHWPGAWQDPHQPIIPGPALSNLIIELVMVQASNPSLIRAVHLDSYRVAVIRGDAPVVPGAFALSESYRTRGHQFRLLEQAPAHGGNV
jgi:SAM-dependent methyltransferase